MKLLARFPMLLMAAVVASPALAQKERPRLAKRVDAAIDRALKERRIVGAVVLIAQDGKLVYRRAAGYADREARRPMREDTVFRLASMTKPIVAMTALALVDQGRLRLDDPVTKWLPEFQPKLPGGRTPKITVHHLLTHTSGLDYNFFQKENGPYNQAKVSSGLDQPGLSIDENLRRLGSVPLLFEPGKQWHYSLSTDVLGAVVARAAEGSLPATVRKYVTGPLGMRDTAFSVGDRRRLATPYADGKPRPVRMGALHRIPMPGESAVLYAPSRIFDRNSYPSGGAGMVGTASDYLKLLETLRRQGVPILTKATGQRMVGDQTPGLEAGGPGWGFSYVSAIARDPKRTGTPHSKGTLQWGGAYGSHWFVDAKRGLSVVILTNTAIEGMSGRFPQWVTQAVYR